ncbi:hypothetical protein B0H66DRAFT_605544 [Apodospora peruviana]|uniref:Hydrophobin n=1 Tax=Apodospora peruviana TaxID=516989 RepID=A0AAE0M0I2_9PEZI|nr:hypothetical protein B0H66DRAFT_605544 [Apodospora peruviana]
MQFSSIFTILAIAMTTAAAPAEVEARNGGSPSCNTDQKAVCCNTIVGAVLCDVVNILSTGTCSAGSYCCSTDAPLGAFINIQALNCVKAL